MGHIDSTQAATIEVPVNQPTIEAAVSVANNGDTILVHDGTYVENISVIGKSITIQSINGAASTIIDGNRLGSVIFFQNSTASLNGFTVRNGAGSWGSGGGVHCVGSSSTPTIAICLIDSNTAQSDGGGICGQSPVVERCQITANSARGGGGCTRHSSSGAAGS